MKEINTDTVRAQVRNLLKIRGITLTQLSKDSGVSQTTLNKYFKRCEEISQDSLYRIINALEGTVIVIPDEVIW